MIILNIFWSVVVTAEGFLKDFEYSDHPALGCAQKCQLSEVLFHLNLIKSDT